MDIIIEIFGMVDFKSFEVGIEDKFMSGDHFVCTKRNNFAFLIDLMNDYAESVKFGEIL